MNKTHIYIGRLSSFATRQKGTSFQALKRYLDVKMIDGSQNPFVAQIFSVVVNSIIFEWLSVSADRNEIAPR